MTKSTTTRWLIGSVAGMAILLGSVALVTSATVAQDGGGKQTQTQQGPGGGEGGGQGQGQGGQGGGGHEDGDGHEDGEEGHEGEGGHDPIGGGGEGAGQGQGGQGGDGGKPVWAQEGIPQVELGRLNVIRSPDSVLDRAFAEALAGFAPAMGSLYEMSASAFADEAESNWEGITIIDSPLQNLALLRELWTTTKTSLPGVDPTSFTDLSAIFLGVASDKNVKISEDTVLALAIIIGAPLTDSQIESIADKAEEVRLGVLAGHG